MFEYLHNEDEELIGIKLENGVTITHYHDQGCCENVYADWGYLEGCDISPLLVNGLINIEIVEGAGFRLNGIFVPAYNSQNGYYSDNLTITINYGNFEVSQDVSRLGGIKDDIF
jgi:hypothetical protein